MDDDENRKADIILDILAERRKQDTTWGGPEHDDKHDALDWSRYIEFEALALHFPFITPDKERAALIKIAALAFAAIESIDRKVG